LKSVKEIVYDAIISECTPAVAELLAKFVQDTGQLEVVDPDAYNLNCASCGRHDTVALFCAECELAVTNNPLKPPVENKMREMCREFGKT
jgi:hypothetical protein